MPEALQGRHVLVGVGGSVAAVKAAALITELRRHGAEVRVAMTAAAAQFIMPLALRSLSGHPVAASLWEAPVEPGIASAAEDAGMVHLSLADWADVYLVMAASANLIARLALGLGDDVVTATALASTVPLLVAPAMETAMWQHPATQANVATLQQRGAILIGPESGRLASGKQDQGRMADVADLLAAVERAIGA